jgi:hypothetical protein
MKNFYYELYSNGLFIEGVIMASSKWNLTSELWKKHGNHKLLEVREL